MKGECMKRLYFAILICFFICIPVKAQEKETETIEQLVEEKMEGTFDFRDIDEMLHEIMPGKNGVWRDGDAGFNRENRFVY